MAEAQLHRYQASCRWEGSTGAGYEEYSRAHRVALGPNELSLSADPAFRGDPKLSNPEQLLLAAAVSCQLLSFLAIAARARLDVVRYADDAEAEMLDRPRQMRIERITLRPRITLAAEAQSGPKASIEQVRKLVEQAHRECFIANTLGCEMAIEPAVEFGA